METIYQYSTFALNWKVLNTVITNTLDIYYYFCDTFYSTCMLIYRLINNNSEKPPYLNYNLPDIKL
jgi:hypothetical protein